MLQLPVFSQVQDFAVGKAIGDHGEALSPCPELLRRESFEFFGGLFSRRPFLSPGGGSSGGGLGEGGGDDCEGYGEFEEVKAVVVLGIGGVVVIVVVGLWGLNSRGDGRVVRGFGKGFEFGVWGRITKEAM